MKQTGTVTKLLDGGLAQVSIERGTACGHCTGCGECVYGKQIFIEAVNKVLAKPGDKVTVESETGVIMQVAVLIYLVPVVMLFLGYGLGALAHLSQGRCILASFVSLLIGIVFITLLGRRHKKIDYTITGIH